MKTIIILSVVLAAFISLKTLPPVHGQLTDLTKLPYDKCQTPVENRFCFGGRQGLLDAYPAGQACLEAMECEVLVYAEVSSQTLPNGHNIHWYLFSDSNSTTIFWLSKTRRYYNEAKDEHSHSFLPFNQIFVQMNTKSGADPIKSQTFQIIISPQTVAKNAVLVVPDSPMAIASFNYGRTGKLTSSKKVFWFVEWTSKATITTDELTTNVLSDNLYPNAVRWSHPNAKWNGDYKVRFPETIFKSKSIVTTTTEASTTTTEMITKPTTISTVDGNQTKPTTPSSSASDSNTPSRTTPIAPDTSKDIEHNTQSSPGAAASNNTKTIIIAVVIVALIVIAAIAIVFYTRRRSQRKNSPPSHSRRLDSTSTTATRTPAPQVIPVMVPVMMMPAAMSSNQISNYSQANSHQYSMVGADDKSTVASRAMPSTALQSMMPSTSPSTATKASDVQPSSVSTGGLSTYFNKNDE